MDVRCEKCNTEYELDESRLKPGGVTVKCTTCGHMFKIRKRSPTQSGIATARADRPSAPVPSAAPPSGSGPVRASTGIPDLRAQTGGSGPVGEGERNWIIRLDNGETRTCKELGMLQQWIITGAVSRESMISRSGKTWKRLGDIAELSSFFIVADEARQARSARESGQITPPRGAPTVPRPDDAKATMMGMGALKPLERETVVEPLRAPPPGRTPSAAPPAPRTPTGPAATLRMAAPQAPTIRQPPAPPASAPQAPTLRQAPDAALLSTPPPASPPSVPHAPTLLAHAAPSTQPAPPPRMPPASPPPPPARTPSVAPPAIPPPPSERATGAWANEDVKAIADDTEVAGPMRGAVRPVGNDAGFGGVVRPVPTDDAAFVGGLGPRTGRGDAPAESMVFDDDITPARRSPTLWIALGSLVVIAAAAAVVYFAFLRAGDERRPAVADGASDGGAVALTVDAGAGDDPAVTPPADAAVSATDDLIDEARVHLGRESIPSLVAAEKRLAETNRVDAVTLALRARLLTAQAQIYEDEAAFADAKTADKVRRESKKQVLAALGLVQKALKAGAQDKLANAVMADVLRLQGKPAKELRRYLDAAGDEREGKLVAALVALRDKELDRAATLLGQLDSGDGALEVTGDVRPRWYRARVALARGKHDDARAAAEAVLAAVPEHAGARALLAKLGSLASSDPMPPEDGGGSGGGGGTGPGSSAGSGTGTGTGSPPTGAVGGDSYDKLLAKANKLAEVDCGQAMPYYTKALEQQPNGVEALTGTGFCHIDAKQFASAHSKFRAALGISPRYERALWGVAEAYQQQGRTDLAIKAYEDYLEVYPSSAAAQRQLDRLQGKTQGTPSPPEGGSAPDPGAGGGDKPEPKPEPDPESAPAATP